MYNYIYIICNFSTYVVYEINTYNDGGNTVTDWHLILILPQKHNVLKCGKKSWVEFSLWGNRPTTQTHIWIRNCFSRFTSLCKTFFGQTSPKAASVLTWFIQKNKSGGILSIAASYRSQQRFLQIWVIFILQKTLATHVKVWAVWCWQ